MRITAPRILAALTLTASAAWAAWPLGEPLTPASTAQEDATEESGALTAATGDAHVASAGAEKRSLDAFRTPVWIIPPPPPEPEKPPPPPPPLPPLKLQLLSIMREPGDSASAPGSEPPPTYSAAFYDPTQDKIVTVTPGTVLDGARKVTAVDAASVTIEERSGSRSTQRTLRLDGASGEGRGR